MEISVWEERKLTVLSLVAIARILQNSLIELDDPFDNLGRRRGIDDGFVRNLYLGKGNQDKRASFKV